MNLKAPKVVFASNDKFHREMWGATSGVHSFVWGKDLKDDLRRQIETRAQDKESAACGLNQTPDATSKPSSVIAEMWRTYMRAQDKSDQPKPAKTFEDLDPEIQKQFKDDMKEFDKMDRARRDRV